MSDEYLISIDELIYDLRRKVTEYTMALMRHEKNYEPYAKRCEEADARLRHRLQEIEEQNEQLLDALTQIKNWCQAYPLKVFPEPDFKEVRKLLEAGGITVDSVSASNMRHVLRGIERILSTAIDLEENKDA